ncbi:ROK family protein [Aquirufa rosea]|uniref:ROK family protein n=1 Tax=Aquirufa rosea TaxID=2509241 RepID=A0A4Q1BY82_9BACT|nr:ROK family protein [Aquirufa rosea]RXK47661.1 ROK family protein [Aquirufa rosea]
MKQELLWGIDLGGTKIECAVLDKQNPSKVVVRERIDTESTKGYQHIVSQIKVLVDRVSGILGEKPTAIGFATPGVLNPLTNTMKNCNTVCLNGQPLATDLTNTLNCEVKLANDANCFALAETLLGAVQDVNPKAEVVFGVIMGTGVGGGLVVHGKIIEGLHGIGGEWGHNILEEGGEACYCGKSGCVETVISGTALERYYEKNSGTKMKLKDILLAAQSSQDAVAEATVERLVDYFGRGMSTLINVIDPDVIVIGGGVGNVDLLYTEGYERIKRYIFNSGEVHTPVVKPKLGDSAGVFGAAMLFS